MLARGPGRRAWWRTSRSSTSTGSRTSSRSRTPATASASLFHGLDRLGAVPLPRRRRADLPHRHVARRAGRRPVAVRVLDALPRGDGPGVAAACSTATRSAAALDAVSDHLMPGRRADARGPSRKELVATTVLALSLDEASVKVSASPPDDTDDDLDLPIWAGVVPLAGEVGHARGRPRPDARLATSGVRASLDPMSMTGASLWWDIPPARAGRLRRPADVG